MKLFYICKMQKPLLFSLLKVKDIMHEATERAVLLLCLGAVGEVILGRIVSEGFTEDVTFKVRSKGQRVSHMNGIIITLS